MKQARWFTCAVAVILMTLGVAADEHGEHPEFLAQSYHVKVLPGHALEFEEAYSEHLKQHAKAGDPTPIHVWEVVAGQHVGSYFIRVQGMTWAGMDEVKGVANDGRGFRKTVSPHVETLSRVISELMPEVSNWPADSGTPRMVEVTMFTLDYEHIGDFFSGMGRLHSIITEHEVPYAYAWWKVVAGGRGAQVYLAMPRNSWSEFKEPSPNLWQIAAEAMGERESEELRARIGAAIEGEESFVVVHRPDLSHLPE